MTNLPSTTMHTDSFLNNWFGRFHWELTSHLLTNHRFYQWQKEHQSTTSHLHCQHLTRFRLRSHVLHQVFWREAKPSSHTEEFRFRSIKKRIFLQTTCNLVVMYINLKSDKGVNLNLINQIVLKNSGLNASNCLSQSASTLHQLFI